MPLGMVGTGENRKIIKVSGKDTTRRFLESLGFVPGAEVSIISELGGNMIVNVKDSRVAIDSELARCILV
ncbi:MAG: ferrous iron transport protein A [Oscillospiraceae bacterium]|nr:ferrous iron transport protein A [Oscillospiraceae bacterium]